MPADFRAEARRIGVVSACCVALALAAAGVAQALTALIGLFTNLAFYGRLSGRFVSPWQHHLGPLVVLVPVLGGLLVGLMARLGSKAIRGHGIPEAMEQVLTNKSRIPARMTVLKPLSAAVSNRRRRSFRRGRADHRHRQRARLVARSVLASQRERTQNAARGGGGGGHGGHVR